MDDELVAIVDSVAGFAGWSVDSTGVPTIFLTDTSMAAHARSQVERLVARTRQNLWRDERAVSAAKRVKLVAFDFRQLRTWTNIAEAILDGEPEAVYADANEATNRVEIGLASSAAVARVSEQLVKRGVPVEAFDLQVVPAARSLSRINDPLRPVPGGVQIWSYGGQGECTLGFNASLGPTGPIGFVTNSHCLPWMGSASYVSVGQPDNNGAHLVGFELLDPSPWQNTSDCLSYRVHHPNGVCRYSDATFVNYAFIPSDSVDFGYIARTMFSAPLNTQPGSLTINPSNPHFEIASKFYAVPQGAYLNRLGQESGWTFRNVSHTCVTAYSSGTGGGAKLWCQHRMGGGSTGQIGDSGGPLWVQTYCDNGQLSRPDGTQCVALAGILWGRDGDRLMFSQVMNIEIDFNVSLGVRPADKPSP